MEFFTKIAVLICCQGKTIKYDIKKKKNLKNLHIIKAKNALEKSNGKATNRNWSNQKANPALKTLNGK